MLTIITPIPAQHIRIRPRRGIIVKTTRPQGIARIHPMYHFHNDIHLADRSSSTSASTFECPWNSLYSPTRATMRPEIEMISPNILAAAETAITKTLTAAETKIQIPAVRYRSSTVASLSKIPP